MNLRSQNLILRNGLLIIHVFFAVWLIYVYKSNSNYAVWIPLLLLVLATISPFFMPVKMGYNIMPKIQMVFLTTPFLVLFGVALISNLNWGWTPEMRNGINLGINLRLAIIGAVGALGFSTGILLASQSNQFSKKYDGFVQSRRPFNKVTFLGLMCFSVMLSYMSAPTNTVFGGAYGGASLNTIAVYLNFPAAYLVSYSVIILLLVDSESDFSDSGRIKRRIVFWGILYIAIFLQLIRGDREILGLFFAIIAMYLTRFHRLGHNSQPILNIPLLKYLFNKRSRRVFIFGFFGLFFLLAVGSLRFTISAGNYGISNIFYANPWTMALLTIVAFLNSDLEKSLLWGSTYVDYFLSIPPGFITRALGVQRAIEANNNLAVTLVETGISSGGQHIVLPALQNFGLVGVFVIMCIYSYTSSIIERNALRGHLFSQLLWLNLLAVIPLWFWYGEMSAIRAVMATIIVYLMSRVKIFKR